MPLRLCSATSQIGAWGGVETTRPEAPLLASVTDPMEPVGYQALYKHVRSWISKAIAQAELPAKSRMKLSRASTHWLHHTFGTRGVARGVPFDVLQTQMGHSSSAIITGFMDAHRWGGGRTNCRRHSTRHWVLYGTTPLVCRADRLHKGICGKKGAAIFWVLYRTTPFSYCCPSTKA